MNRIEALEHWKNCVEREEEAKYAVRQAERALQEAQDASRVAWIALRNIDAGY